MTNKLDNKIVIIIVKIQHHQVAKTLVIVRFYYGNTLHKQEVIYREKEKSQADSQIIQEVMKIHQ